MVDTYLLSDGQTHLDVPDGEDAQRYVSQGEAQLATMYGKQAAAQNAPVTTPGHVYSATRTYPNNVLGHGMAWLDHNAGGNWANTNIVDAANKATGGWADTAAGSLGRIESDVPGIVDIPGAIYNTAKHYTPLGTRYDAPYLTENLRSSIGIPELPPDAGYGQRIFEGGSSALLGGGSAAHGVTALPSLLEAVRAFGLTGASTALSDFGGMIGGEAGSLIGSLTGAGGGELAARKALHTTGRGFGHPDAPEMRQQANDLGFDPSSTTLSSPVGQRFIKILGALPLTGSPIENANDATREAIKNVRDVTAADLAGPGGIPPRITPESIGTELIRGAQQSAPALKAQQGQVWNNINQIMAGRDVDMAPLVSLANSMTEGNTVSPTNRDIVRGVGNEVASMAPGGSEYDAGARGPAPPLPQPTMEVPWEGAKDVRTNLLQRLRGKDINVPDNMIAALKNAATDAMRNASQRAGLRNIFDTARTSYAQSQPLLDALYNVGGKPVGNTRAFENPMQGGEAFNWLVKNRQRSDALAPFADSSTFPTDNWGRVAGQWVGQMGDAPQNTFRPEHFARDWQALSDEVQSQVAQGAHGAPTRAWGDLSNLANVARNFVTPVSRHGLMSGMGAAIAVEALMRTAEQFGAHALPPGMGFLAPGLLGYGLSHGIESDAYRRGAAGQSMMSPETRAGLVTRALPVAGAVTGQEIQNRRDLQQGPQ